MDICARLNININNHILVLIMNSLSTFKHMINIIAMLDMPVVINVTNNGIICNRYNGEKYLINTMINNGVIYFRLTEDDGIPLNIEKPKELVNALNGIDDNSPYILLVSKENPGQLTIIILTRIFEACNNLNLIDSNGNIFINCDLIDNTYIDHNYYLTDTIIVNLGHVSVDEENDIAVSPESFDMQLEIDVKTLTEHTQKLVKNKCSTVALTIDKSRKKLIFKSASLKSGFAFSSEVPITEPFQQNQMINGQIINGQQVQMINGQPLIPIAAVKKGKAKVQNRSIVIYKDLCIGENVNAFPKAESLLKALSMAKHCENIIVFVSKEDTVMLYFPLIGLTGKAAIVIPPMNKVEV